MSDAPIHLVCPHCQAVNRLPASRLTEDPRCGQCRAPLFTGEPLPLDAQGFERQLRRSELPLLVDFWAPWCGPCRAMAPTFQAAAAALEPQLRLVKIDTEAHPDIAARYAIRSIPTLVLFRNGQELTRQSGAMPLAPLLSWARQALKLPR